MRICRKFSWRILSSALVPRRLSSSSTLLTDELPSLSDFTPDRIRNFSIIAHVDHGKSTLSDRLLEETRTIRKSADNEQVLDRLKVERDRGITVKAQVATMFHQHCDLTYMLNLIDTPGHADFSYEVSRSLAACDGAILLVDANRGVQAQTVANFWLAFENDLTVLPVLNKIDLENADPDRCCEQLKRLFDFDPSEIMRISAKSGLNVGDLLPAIIDRLPPPEIPSGDEPFSAFIFDSWFEMYRGCLASVLVKSGSILPGQSIKVLSTGRTFEVKNVGIMYPEQSSVQCLYAGQVGFIEANMKTPGDARVGDTLCLSSDSKTIAFSGFKIPKPVVFAGLFPIDQTENLSVRKALERLLLNDPSVTSEVSSSAAMGQGWRLGFMGLLHLEVFSQRLDNEYDVPVVLTAPTVTYKAKLKPQPAILRKYALSAENRTLSISDPSAAPLPSDVEQFLEPMVLATIVSPADCYRKLMELCNQARGVEQKQEYIDDSRFILKYKLPLAEIITDFHDQLKKLTSGYGSFDYEEIGCEPVALKKLTVFLNNREVEEFSQLVAAVNAKKRAGRLAFRLKEEIPRQIIDISIKVKSGGKVIAGAKIPAYKKDVTAKLYGGDITRRMKVLKRQGEGKAYMKTVVSVNVPKDAFVNIMKR